MNKFVIMFVLCALVAYNRASPATKRDIGLTLRAQNEDHTVIYGNGIPGKDAEVTEYEFNKDDIGNYNFA